MHFSGVFWHGTLFVFLYLVERLLGQVFPDEIRQLIRSHALVDHHLTVFAGGHIVAEFVARESLIMSFEHVQAVNMLGQVVPLRLLLARGPGDAVVAVFSRVAHHALEEQLRPGLFERRVGHHARSRGVAGIRTVHHRAGIPPAVHNSNLLRREIPRIPVVGIDHRRVDDIQARRGPLDVIVIERHRPFWILKHRPASLGRRIEA